ncbi:5-oxoprolinase subunit PxpA [Vibrio ruber]|uniref:5-oxoprolinase subunit PxpA n=1 Tax=Vibrio ruber TaxID=184755 RepID=UPI002893470D|nr:5-oxoprolinase subunit PxpA [Vibrio ruber]WNJ97913.1 5-oxoprolinase subunit PxpA [Vibrio ruber]
MVSVDVNSDIGEGFGHWYVGDNADAQIIPLISSANIATGFHAGDPSTMYTTVALARKHGVSVGAHPGYRDLLGFGRRHIHTAAHELIHDIIYQIGALREIASAHTVTLQHVKPHGALYMHLANDHEAANLFIHQIHRLAPELILYVMHGSLLHQLALDKGHPVICEFYADREYDQSGSIVFTRKTGALNLSQIAQKILKACRENKVTTIDNQEISVQFDSICIHSDAPGALAVVQTVRQTLEQAGISIQAPNCMNTKLYK